MPTVPGGIPDEMPRHQAFGAPNAGGISPAGSALFVVLERDRVKLQPVIDQLVAELAGDLGLQPLDLLGLELDDLAGAQVDQMIVVRIR